MKVNPKKHLGQHFLTETSVATRLAEAIAAPEGRVLEIGPGTGMLTRALQERKFDRLKLVEIDRDSIAFLKEKHPEFKDDLIEGDFLRLDINGIFGGETFTLAGNFPYNISSQILFRIFENREIIPEMVGMFQKEVAERVSTGPGSKTYGILSVLLQAYYQIDYLFTVNENCFNPPPKVKSAVMRLSRNERKALPVSDNFFKAVVKAGFNQRRKTLRNSLSAFLPNPAPEALGEVLKLRPEQLSVDAFAALAQALYQIAQDRPTP